MSDRFFTKPKIAEECHQHLLRFLNKHNECFNENDFTWIDPSCGDGAFLNLLPPPTSLGIDIEPTDKIESRNFMQKDFLGFSSSCHPQKTIVIGNPPFGHRGDMAIDFINHASTMADTIAFIVPKTLTKFLAQIKIRRHLRLAESHQIPPNSFCVPSENTKHKEYSINTEFQIWTKLSTGDLRLYELPKVKHPDFSMWQYNNTTQAERVFNYPFDFAVPRQGFEDYTRAETKQEKCERTKQWILFKGHSPKALESLRSLDFQSLSEKNSIIPGFGKADVIAEYERLFSGNKKAEKKLSLDFQ